MEQLFISFDLRRHPSVVMNSRNPELVALFEIPSVGFCYFIEGGATLVILCRDRSSMSYNIFRSKKGFEKLGHEGYLYNLDKRNANYTLWRCELSKKPGHKCSGRAKLTASTIEVSFIIVSL